MMVRARPRDIDHLPKNAANYTALTPLWFLERAATVHPTRNSLIHGSRHYTWQQTYHRCRRFASALSNHSIGLGNTVAVIAPNIPAVYEAHFGIPMAGAVLNPLNIRLNASTIAFLLGHCTAAAVIVDQEFFSLAEEALKIWSEKAKTFSPPLLIVIGDENCDPKALKYALGKGAVDYEDFLQSGDPEYAWKPPEDEWQSISLGYTSGTTASPKGVVLHHRGAYLMSLSGALIWGMTEGAVYLWTLPMFHCNGWCYTWTLAALCGTNICLRQVALLRSLLNGKIFVEWICPAVAQAYQCHISAHATSYGEESDIYNDDIVRGITVKGMAWNIIQKLPVQQFNSSKMFKLYNDSCCSICFQDFEYEEFVRTLPKCGHFFHSVCIDKWLVQQGSCPMCRIFVSDL